MQARIVSRRAAAAIKISGNISGRKVAPIRLKGCLPQYKSSPLLPIVNAQIRHSAAEKIIANGNTHSTADGKKVIFSKITAAVADRKKKKVYANVIIRLIHAVYIVYDKKTITAATSVNDKNRDIK